MKNLAILFLLLFSSGLFAQNLNEGFEGATFPPEGWLSYRGTNNLGTVYDWEQSGTNPYNGDYSAFVRYEYIGSGLAEDWLVTPQLQVSAGNNILSFWIRDNWATDYGSDLYIKYSLSSQTDQSSFSDIISYSETDMLYDTYSQKTIDLSTYNEQDIYIAFVWVQDNGDNLYLDDVNGPLIYVPFLPNCATLVSPADAGTEISVAATLNWTSGGGFPTGYKINFGTDNPPTNILNAYDLGNVNTYDPPGDLDYSQTYYWQVVPYNGNGDKTGCAIWSFTTGTDPTINSFPHCESFDEPGIMPYGWTQTSTISDRWNVNNSSFAGGSPDELRAAWVNGSGISRLISPPIDFGGTTNPALEFKHYYDDYNNAEDITLGIQSTTDGGVTWIIEWSFSNGFGDIGPETKIIYLTNYGSETRIAWFLDGNHIYFDNWYIDDICFKDVTDVPACAINISPTDVSFLVATSTSLEWNSGSGTTSGYYMYFGTDDPPTNILNGADMGDGTIYVPVAELELDQTYRWQVVPYNIVGPATGCPVWTFTTTPFLDIDILPWWQTLSGAIDAGGARHYSFDMEAGKSYNFSLCDQDGVGATFSGNGDMTLYSDAMLTNLVWYLDGDPSCGNDATTLGTAYENFSPTVDQKYYLVVEDNSGAGPVTFNLAYQGNFIPLTITEVCQSTAVPDFGVDEGIFYEMTLSSQFFYNFSTCTQDYCPGESPDTDADFRLYDENGTELWYIDGLSGCDWDASTYGQPQQDYNPTLDGIYYLKIHGYNNVSGTGIILAHSYAECGDTYSLPFIESFDYLHWPSCWTQTSNISDRWYIANSSLAVGLPYEFRAFPATGTGVSRLISPAIDCGSGASPYMSFKQYYWDVGPGATLGVETSIDGGLTWYEEWSFDTGTGNIGPTIISIQLENYSPNMLISWFISGDHSQFYGWWVDDISVEACDPVTTYPYIVDFEDGIVPPVCWSQIINTPGVTWEAGPGYAFSNHWLNQDEWLITPEFDLSSLNSPYLVFDWKTDYNWMVHNPNGDLFCRISTDGGGSWTTLWSEDDEVPFNFDFYTKNIDLNNYVGATSVKFAFQYVTIEYAAQVFLDNVMVQEGSSCPPPVDFRLSNTTLTSADFSWTETGSATTWDLEYGLAGFIPTGLPSPGYDDVTTNVNLNLSGLNPNTMYSCYVRADCGGDNINTSNWIGPITFWSMDCLPVSSYPYIEDFNTSVPPQCWIVNSSNAGNSWQTGWAASAHCPGSTAQDEWFISPVFDFTTETSPVLNFKWNTYYPEMVSPNNNGDYYCKISIDNGVTWTQLWSEEDEGYFDWSFYKTKVIDLSEYGGNPNVQIAFQLLSFNTVYNGVWLEDFTIVSDPVIELSPLPWWQNINGSFPIGGNKVYSVSMVAGRSYNFSICDNDGVGGSYSGSGNGDFTLYSDVSLTNPVWHIEGEVGCSLNATTLGTGFENYTPSVTQDYYLVVDDGTGIYAATFNLAYQGDFIELPVITENCQSIIIPDFDAGSGVYCKMTLEDDLNYNFSTCSFDYCGGDASSNNTDFHFYNSYGTLFWYNGGPASCNYDATTYGSDQQDFMPPSDGAYYLYINDAYDNAGSGILLAYSYIDCGIAFSYTFEESFDNIYQPACWSQTSTISPRWTVSNTSTAGGLPYEMKATWVAGIGTSRLLTPGINLGGASAPSLIFNHMYNDYGAGVTIGVETSTDGGSTWVTEWSITSGSGSIGPETQIVPLINFGTNTLVAWFIDGDHYQFNYWYVDDVKIEEAPITTIASPTYCYGDQILVPVTVKFFEDIGGISLTVDYDPAFLSYNNVIPNAVISSCYTGVPTPGEFRLAWSDGTGINLSEDEVLFTLIFDYIGPASGGTTLLTWPETPPELNEYSDPQGNVYNRIPFGDYFVDGTVTINPLPVLSSVSLQASIDAAGPPWDYLVSGYLSGGYSMCIIPSVTNYYLDINALTSSPALGTGILNPFTLSTTSLPAIWWTYWAGKGVSTPPNTLPWQDQMWEIINGNAPFFYIKYTTGLDYILVDGLHYWIAQQPTPNPGAEPILTVPGDYPNLTYTYTGDVTDVNGCVSLPVSVLMSFNACDITGTLKYNNTAQTGLNNMLLTLNSTPVVLATTGAGGAYTFSTVPSGTYTITFNDNGKTAGGINATDAAQVNYWGVFTVTTPWAIEKVRFFAGDVNNDNNVVALDAQKILAYFVNTGIPPFDFNPKWKFWLTGDMISANPYSGPADPSISIGSSSGSQDLYGLCTGDFNQSFTPGTSKSASESLLLKDGKNIFAEVGTELELPIVAGMDMDVGAVSLILNFPSDKVEISEVFLTSDPSSPLMYNISGDELRIGWNSLIPAYLDKGESLITLKMKVIDESGDEGISMSLAADPLNELADGDFFVINDAVLIADVIHTSALGIANNMADKLAFANHPNPFKGTTNFVYSLPVDGRVILEIYDLVGNKVMTAVDEAQTAGEYTVELQTNRLQPGVYTATLRLSNEDSMLVRTIKIISK